MISPLLATKLHRPLALAKSVRRAHLVEKLNDGLAAGRRLTLVSAPPGFGKTTCVVEWLNGVALPVAWLSLEPADDDPGRFFSYLLAALQGIDAHTGREMAAALHAGQVPIASLTTALLNELLHLGTKFILVLDDFHVLREKAVLDAVATLIAGGPENMHVVLITREDPLLPLARPRAHDQLTEIRAADLRFSGSEAAQLLVRQMGLPLSDADIAGLEERTEGWVAGLQLAGLSLRGQPDPSRFIARLSGSHRYILSYLTEEVLDRQPGDIRDFLLHTSVLSGLNEDLSAAVTGRPDCARLLEHACAANLFLIPLDENGDWYRYHHLFAQLLLTRLRQTVSADELKALHCRASDWLAANGHTDEAIRHALEVRDFERAVALVESTARTMIFAGRMHTLRTWIAAFPAECRVDYPRLEVYRTWIELLEGKLDFGEKAAQAREDMLQALPPSPENDRLRVELTAVLCRYSPLFGDTQRAIRLAQAALGAVDERDLVSRARLIFGLAVAHTLEGKAPEAEGEFAECVRLATMAGDAGLAAEALGLFAQDQAHCGKLGEAARLYGEVIALARQQAGEQPGAGEPPLAGLGYLGLAEIYAERYELERAEASVERGMELCGRGGLDGIYTGYRVRSRLRQARGDLAGALAELETVERTFRRGDDPLLATRRVLIARASGDTAKIAALLEPWIKLLQAAPAGSSPRPPELVLDVVKMLVAQGYVAQGQNEKALELLTEMEAGALRDGRYGLLIQVYLLESLALQAEHLANDPGDPSRSERAHKERDSTEWIREVRARSDESRARQSLVSALQIAEPEGYALVFLEERPAVTPLLLAIRDDVSIDERLRRYAGKLLAAGTPPDSRREGEPAGRSRNAGLGNGGSAGQRDEDTAPAEALSAREREILRLIGEGCTNQEIAGRLVITLHTVKKHSSNIFGKLGVSSRTQAVARARRLGLIE